MSVGFLERQGYAVVEADPTANRTKVVRLKPRGQAARATYRRLLDDIEKRRQARFAADAVRGIRE